MTSEPHDLQHASFKDRAAALLRTPAGAEATEARAAFLREVKQAEFVPSPSLVRAAELLHGLQERDTDSPTGYSERVESFRSEYEKSLREEIEEFAGRFFSLDVDDRRKQFEVLQERASEFPRLETRLRVLEEGLDVDLEELAGESPQVVELAQRVCALHVLRPQARARVRQTMLRDLAMDGRNWDQPARYLRRKWNRFSSLAPEFINPLAIYTKKRRQLAKKQTRLMRRGVKIYTTSKNTGWTAKAIGPAITIVVMALINIFSREWERPKSRPRTDVTIPYTSQPVTLPSVPKPYTPPPQRMPSSPRNAPPPPQASAPSQGDGDLPSLRSIAWPENPIAVPSPAVRAQPPTGGAVVHPAAGLPIQSWTPPALPPAIEPDVTDTP